MKVVIVSQSYHPRPGGVTENVHHTAHTLRSRGHDVTVITTNFGDGVVRDVDVIRIGRNVLVPMNSAWVNMTVGTRLSRDLKRLLRSLDPDVIHTHCPLTPTLPLLTLRAAPRGCRIVGTFHAAAASNFAYRLFRPCLQRAAERLDARIAVSKAALSLAHKYFPGKYNVIPNGVDCLRFSPATKPLGHLRDGRFNVLFVGRLDKRKGLKYLFRAFSIVSRPARRRTRLIVVGDNGIRKHLLPRLPGDVELLFTGVVAKELLPRYFASADVFCSPATERESFGIVLLEAMATGVPVVGTSIPGYLTLLRDRWNSLVVPPRDPEALARSIEELWENTTLRLQLRSNGVRFAQQYRWERVVDKLEQLYRRKLEREWDGSAEGEDLMETPIRA